MVTKGKGQVGDGWMGFGIGRCTLLYMEWIVNGGLLHSTGKSTQCSVITFMRMDICICMAESLCFTQKLTQRCKSTTIKKNF